MRSPAPQSRYARTWGYAASASFGIGGTGCASACSPRRRPCAHCAECSAGSAGTHEAGAVRRHGGRKFPGACVGQLGLCTHAGSVAGAFEGCPGSPWTALACHRCRRDGEALECHPGVAQARPGCKDNGGHPISSSTGPGRVANGRPGTRRRPTFDRCLSKPPRAPGRRQPPFSAPWFRRRSAFASVGGGPKPGGGGHCGS